MENNNDINRYASPPTKNPMPISYHNIESRYTSNRPMMVSTGPCNSNIDHRTVSIKNSIYYIVLVLLDISRYNGKNALRRFSPFRSVDGIPYYWTDTATTRTVAAAMAVPIIPMVGLLLL
jgi:hypothetical protein